MLRNSSLPAVINSGIPAKSTLDDEVLRNFGAQVQVRADHKTGQLDVARGIESAFQGSEKDDTFEASDLLAVGQ